MKLEMNSQLHIPLKLKAGFNLREDTFSGKLAYVIMHDGKKWRKESSWNSWRQTPGQEIHCGHDYIDGKYVERPKKVLGDEVTPIEFDNVPTSGFVLNKKVGGYKSDWNMRQTYARVYDPRGFEFEINVVNLLYILENCNCMKGKGLEGEFVYSWDGKDLVLLPCSSWEYEKANVFTNLQSQKISAKDLAPGISYKTKKEEDLIYVGRYMWYETEWYSGRNKRKTGRFGKKCHIFYSSEKQYNGHFIIKNDVSFLAAKNSDQPVSNFAEIVDEFNANPRSSDIVKWELIPVEVSVDFPKKDNSCYGQPQPCRTTYFKQVGESIYQYSIRANYEYVHGIPANSGQYQLRGFSTSGSKTFNPITKEVGYLENPYHYSNYWNKPEISVYDKNNLQTLGYCDLFITLESGKRIKINDLDEL